MVPGFMMHGARITHREHGAPPLGEPPVHLAQNLQDVGAELHHPLVLRPEHVEVVTVQYRCTVDRVDKSENWKIKF